MPTIFYIDPTGSRHEVEAAVGASVMDTAVKNNVPGIIGECGGFLSCASCHVYVDDAWVPVVGTADAAEDETEEMILGEITAERLAGSRLGCQIKMTQELDGLLVRVAPEQS